MQYEPLIADRFYHIFNRGNNKEDIFFEDRNYEYFLRLVEKYLISVCEIYAYCFLKNHFHFLIKTKDYIDSNLISKAFSNFFNAYSKAINKSYNRTGSLFQDRFKRKIILKESYLRNLIVYIHLNPEIHNLIVDYKNYKFSSYKAILSDQNTFLKRDEILDLFQDKENFEYYHKERKFEKGEKNLDIYLE